MRANADAQLVSVCVCVCILCVRHVHSCQAEIWSSAFYPKCSCIVSGYVRSMYAIATCVSRGISTNNRNAIFESAKWRRTIVYPIRAHIGFWVLQLRLHRIIIIIWRFVFRWTAFYCEVVPISQNVFFYTFHVKFCVKHFHEMFAMTTQCKWNEWKKRNQNCCIDTAMSPDVMKLSTVYYIQLNGIGGEHIVEINYNQIDDIKIVILMGRAKMCRTRVSTTFRAHTHTDTRNFIVPLQHMSTVCAWNERQPANAILGITFKSL